MLPRVSTNVLKKLTNFKSWVFKDNLFHKNTGKVLPMDKTPNVEASDILLFLHERLLGHKNPGRR